MVNCCDCVFWTGDAAGDLGDCRRHAPIIQHVEHGSLPAYGAFPQMFGDESCGEGVIDGERLYKAALREGREAALKALESTTKI